MENMNQQNIQESQSARQLKKLIDHINQSDDTTLGAELQAQWDIYDESEAEKDLIRLDVIKKRIERVIALSNEKVLPYRKRHRLSVKLLLSIAASLLCLFAYQTYLLYIDNQHMLDKQICVSTNQGECASVTMPDESKVTINQNTKLFYRARQYNADERKIDFQGEGYFDIVPDEKKPFTIYTKHVKVMVYGTKFNLSAHEKDSFAELILEQGHLKLTALKTNLTIGLKPGQKAIVDNRTGEIQVFSNQDLTYIAIWKDHKIHFENEKLEKVIYRIEQIYDISITIANKDLLQDLFTGTIPTNNLQVTLNIICETYKMEYTMKDTKLHLSPM